MCACVNVQYVCGCVVGTCPIPRTVKVDTKGPRLMLPLPRQRGTVLVVGVGVVVVDIPGL